MFRRSASFWRLLCAGLFVLHRQADGLRPAFGVGTLGRQNGHAFAACQRVLLIGFGDLLFPDDAGQYFADRELLAHSRATPRLSDISLEDTSYVWVKAVPGSGFPVRLFRPSA